MIVNVSRDIAYMQAFGTLKGFGHLALIMMSLSADCSVEALQPSIQIIVCKEAMPRVNWPSIRDQPHHTLSGSLCRHGR